MTHIEMLTYERDVARAHRNALANILTAIHAQLSPPDVSLPDGRVMRFHDPNAVQTLHVLSERIRAIPDELARAAVEAPGSLPCEGRES